MLKSTLKHRGRLVQTVGLVMIAMCALSLMYRVDMTQVTTQENNDETPFPIDPDGQHFISKENIAKHPKVIKSANKLDKLLAILTEANEALRVAGDEVMGMPAPDPVSPPPQMSGGGVGYFEHLREYTTIKTVMVRAGFSRMKKVLLREYYNYTSSDCATLERNTSSDIKTLRMFNTTCQDDMKTSLISHALQKRPLAIGLPGRFKQKTGSEIWSYVHVIRDARVSTYGAIVTSNLILNPLHCKYNTVGDVPDEMDIYDEVFTVHQYRGLGFWHSSIEVIPRLTPYVQFLNDNPQVYIYLPSTNPLTNTLGIVNLEKRRLVNNTFRAKVLYAPSGSVCVKPALLHTQLISLYARKHLDNNPEARNRIILIKRSLKQRFFNNHESILAMLRERASQYGLEVSVFADDPVPPFNVTRKLFNEAVIVVAPHGAGEANAIFSQPGTVLIETLCLNPQFGIVVMAYRNLAHILGLRYHSLFLGNNCNDVTAEQIQEPVDFFLQNLDAIR